MRRKANARRPLEGCLATSSICDAFYQKADLYPDALAVSGCNSEYTYGELALAANNTARELRARLHPGAVVGLLAKRQPELVVAMIACVRAGITFALLDAAYPLRRIEMLVDLCGASGLLDAADIGLSHISNVPVFRLDVIVESGTDTLFSDANSFSDTAPAYLLFTSGTTGHPKCVAVAHAPLNNFTSWQSDHFSLTSNDRFTLLSGLSHDPVLRDVFTPLSIGASIHVPCQETIRQPGGLHAWMSEVGPTVTHMTPPMGQLLVSGAKAAPLSSLRHIFWGGDLLTPPLVNAAARLAPRAQQTNFFGATETPQAATFFPVVPSHQLENIPIGTGIRGFEAVVVGANGKELPDLELGEIEIRSQFLSLGYFEKGKIARYPGDDACYRTGDIGYRCSDKSVVLVGRKDDQVKIRGFRVDLSEVVSAVCQIEGVASCVALNVGDDDNVKISAFVTLSRPAAERRHGELRRETMALLPSYAVPDEFIILPELPILPNGKIDRQYLMSSRRNLSSQDETRYELSPESIEQRLLEAFHLHLKSKPISLDSSFESLGGDSLSYVTAYLAIEDIIGGPPPQWTSMSISELSWLATPRQTPFFAAIESAIFLRALSISIIVADHFSFVRFTGATSALMFLSGLMFGNLQINGISRTNSISPVLKFSRNLLFQYYTLLAPLIISSLIVGRPAWAGLFLISDVVDWRHGVTVYRSEIFWYIHCLFHILMAYVVIHRILNRFVAGRNLAISTLLACFAIGVVGRDVVPFIADPHFALHGQGSHVFNYNMFDYAPTSHIATFAIAALSTMLSGTRKAILAIAMVCYTLGGLPGYGPIATATLIGAALWVMYAPKIVVPRRLAPIIYNVAGASLFIYLLHFQLKHIIDRILVMPIAFEWAGTIAAGVGAWRLWNLGARVLPRILQRRESSTSSWRNWLRSVASQAR